MAIKINNARVDWNGYEFGLKVEDEVVETGDYRVMCAKMAIDGSGSVVFRAHYVTEWMDAIEDPDY